VGVEDRSPQHQHIRLRNEYHQTLRVLAVVVEQLLKQENGDTIEIDDDALLNAPDLVAWRDRAKNRTSIKVTREVPHDRDD